MNENQRIQANHFRNAIIEECARVVESRWDIDGTQTAKEFAAAIRALKDKP